MLAAIMAKNTTCIHGAMLPKTSRVGMFGSIAIIGIEADNWRAKLRDALISSRDLLASLHLQLGIRGAHPSKPRYDCASSFLTPANRFDELRDDLIQVAHQAVSRHLKDRRFGVFVDRDDDARILDAGQMLDRAGN